MGPIKSSKSFEEDLFEEAHVISDMMAPFLIMIAQILFVRAWPPATDFTILSFDQSFLHEKLSLRSRLRY